MYKEKEKFEVRLDRKLNWNVPSTVAFEILGKRQNFYYIRKRNSRLFPVSPFDKYSIIRIMM